jgi:glutamine amidotransferase
MPTNVAIVDYGTGNLNSVKKSLDRMNVHAVVSSAPADILFSDKIILPGVGHFATAMSRLRSLNLVEALSEAVLVKQKPVLGICLGMEVMARRSEEGEGEGLGWFEAAIVKLDISDRLKYKIPHIGWNQIQIRKKSALMNNIPECSEFYFLHSYHLELAEPQDLLNETAYESVYPSAVEKGNIFGVQYHPEKSHDVGVQLLRNFVEL